MFVLPSNLSFLKGTDPTMNLESNGQYDWSGFISMSQSDFSIAVLGMALPLSYVSNSVGLF
jgi:hypothetical protein